MILRQVSRASQNGTGDVLDTTPLPDVSTLYTEHGLLIRIGMVGRIRILQTLICFLSLIFAPASFAGDGTIAAADRSTAEMAEGAESNDEAWRQHLAGADQKEQEARRNPDADGKPDHEMMEHSRHERHMARMFRMQAREFARSALKALATRGSMSSQSAPPATMSDGRLVDVQNLQRLASVPVTGGEEVENSGSETASFKAAGGGSQVVAPVQEQNVAGVLAPSASASGAKTNGGSAAAGGVNFKSSQLQMTGSQLASTSSQQLNTGAGESQLDPRAISLSTDNADNPAFKTNTAQAAKSLAANRARLMKQMGMRMPASAEESGPIRAKSEDIFSVLHMHYSSLKERGIFYKEGDELPPTPGPSSKLPAFSRGI